MYKDVQVYGCILQLVACFILRLWGGNPPIWCPRNQVKLTIGVRLLVSDTALVVDNPVYLPNLSGGKCFEIHLDAIWPSSCEQIKACQALALNPLRPQQLW